MTLTNLGKHRKSQLLLSEWNSSNVFGLNNWTGTTSWNTGTENATPVGAQTCYDWNVSLSLSP